MSANERYLRAYIQVRRWEIARYLAAGVLPMLLVEELAYASTCLWASTQVTDA